jgi:hypothetical protein
MAWHAALGWKKPTHADADVLLAEAPQSTRCPS